jgi:hypothetical protein
MKSIKHEKVEDFKIFTIKFSFFVGIILMDFFGVGMICELLNDEGQELKSLMCRGA